MLIELIAMAPLAYVGFHLAKDVVGPSRDSLRKELTLEPVKTTLPTNTPSGDTALLVVELLRTDEGWKEAPYDPSIWPGVGTETWIHDTGVKVSVTTYYDTTGRGSDRSSLFVYVQNDAGVYEIAEVSKTDDKIIRAELKAFKTRRRDAKQRALTRALAKRIHARETNDAGSHSGGDTPVAASGSNSSVDVSGSDSSIPTPLLTHDGTKVVKVGTGTDGEFLRLALSANLEKRYGMRGSQSSAKLLAQRITAMGEDYDY